MINLVFFCDTSLQTRPVAVYMKTEVEQFPLQAIRMVTRIASIACG